ncbi:MAG TPA: TonB-dependent receptor [Gammaproteobacteria bacterium]|nr:TonB-dependent receptor [Gammaproteobacteria bacterium]
MLDQRQGTAKGLTIAVSAFAVLAPMRAALAQNTQVEEVTVTGSRIQRDVGFASPVPVTAIDASELNMFEPGLGVAQQLETLPQYFGNVSSDDIAGRVGADVGQSQLNMRGMGANRTLVLLDGSRIVPSDRQSTVSVDYLPSSLIRRVDVVTGGASAAYGADAIAGVTNFILDRQFTGLKIDARTGENAFGDGQYTRGSVTFGGDVGASKQLHIFGTIENRDNDGYRRGDRDDPYAASWDKDQGYVLNPDWHPGAPPGVPQRLTKDYVYDTAATPNGLIRQRGFTYNDYQFTDDGTGVEPFVSGPFASLPGQPGSQSTQVGAPGDPQYEEWKRGNAETFERVGVVQQTAFLGSDLHLSDTMTLWGNALYGRTKNLVEPNTSTLGHRNLAYMTIYQDNAFLPDAVRQAMIADNNLPSIRVDQFGYLNSDWGYRERNENVNGMWSVSGGFDKDLRGDWDLKGSYEYGKAEKRNVNHNWERLDRFYLATDAVQDPENPGTVVCRIQLVARQLEREGRSLEGELHAWALKNTSVFRTDAGAIDPGVPQPIDYPISVDSIDNTISGCVPVNMFGNGNQSQAAMNYIFSDRNKIGVSEQSQTFGELLANGTLSQGWGPGPITAAFGATYRKESISQRILDTAIDALGPPFNVTLPDGTVAVRGIAPIIAGGSANLHRFSSEPTFAGGFNVWEAYAETIVPVWNDKASGRNADLDLALRYTDYSLAGSFLVWKGGLNLQITPSLRFRTTYSHDIREGSFAELFVQQGRGATISDPANEDQSYTVFNLTGGDPHLKAEEANTKVLGFVFQPSQVKGLQFSLDRYSVDLTSAIGTFREQDIVDQCYETGALCDKIDRNPATGFITLIRTTFVNIDAAKVSGWDLETSYRMQPNLFPNKTESLGLRVLGGYMDENSSTPLGGTKIDQAGSAELPKGTLTADLSYNVGNFGVNVQQNWQSRTKRDVSWVEGVDVDDNSVPSVNLTNFGLHWTHDLRSGSFTASLNVNNLFDRDPVIAGTTIVGDLLGRRYSLGFQYNLR